MGQVPVVRQQEQALSILVQPPHGEDFPPPELLRQKVQHRFLPGVLRCGEHPGGLVEHDVGVGLEGQRRPVHRYGAGGAVHLLLAAPGGTAVHRHPALPDELLGLPPGPAARGG